MTHLLDSAAGGGTRKGGGGVLCCAVLCCAVLCWRCRALRRGVSWFTAKHAGIAGTAGTPSVVCGWFKRTATESLNLSHDTDGATHLHAAAPSSHLTMTEARTLPLNKAGV